jgi:hypothetical protein
MKQFQLSEEDFLAAYSLHSGFLVRDISRSDLFVLLVAALLLILPACLLGWFGFAWIAASISLVFLAALCYLIGYRARLRGGIKEQYAGRESLREVVTIQHDDKQLLWGSAAGSFEASWEDIHKYKENVRMFLVYAHGSTFWPILKSAFETEEELLSFTRRLEGVGSGHL